MPRIQSLRAWEILDSRGLPTVEAETVLDDGAIGRAAVPSGASTGEHEALELRDKDPKRFGGKGVLKAVSHVAEDIQRLIKGADARDQRAVDAAMIAADGTPNKGRLGANAMLAVSMAVSRAAAKSEGQPLYAYLRKAFKLPEDEWLLPAPMFNVINGGKHADSGLDIQEFMLVPGGVGSFSDALRAGAEIYQALKKGLKAMKMAVSVGDEGGFAPHLKTHEEALKTIMKAVKTSGYEGRVRPALDCAASEFFDEDGKSGGAYRFEGKPRSSGEMGDIYSGFIKRFGLVAIEDPLAEDDWAGWKSLTASVGSGIRIIGDDIFVTNPQRLERGIREKTANSILIKLNQIGTLSETVDTVLKAQKNGFSCVISHRSGETEDPYIADLSVALSAGAIKSGAPCRSERLAKYNQLLRIEAELGGRARYAGWRCFLKEAAASNG